MLSTYKASCGKHRQCRHSSQWAPGKRFYTACLGKINPSSLILRGARGHGPNPGKNRIVGNEGPITTCPIHRVTKYSGFQDACVRLSFPVPFRKIIFIIEIGLS